MSITSAIKRKQLRPSHPLAKGGKVIYVAGEPDCIFYTNGVDCSEEQPEWLDKKLKEIDPDGTKLIFFSFHCHIDNRYFNNK